MSLLRTLLIALPVFFLSALPGLPAAQAATDGKAVAAEIIHRGDAALAGYRPENHLATAADFSSLYFDVFERSGMELDLGLRSPGLKNEIEVRFGTVNGQAMRGASASELDSAWQALRSKLREAQTLYGGAERTGFMPVFLQSLLILLREGAEAMLVVGALSAYLRRAGGGDRVGVLYAGVGIAIPLSLLTGWALSGAMQASGAPRALLEGVIMLLAAALLFHVSFWLFSRREAQRWQAWIGGQIDSALSRGSLLALGGAACLAVYREGAETVLFYHALAAGHAGEGEAIAAGIGAAGALLVVLTLVFRHWALRLPYRFFFGATAALLYALSIVFTGQGIIELQAAGYLGSRPLPWVPHVAWLGIAPSMQGVIAQASLLLLPLLVWCGRKWRTSPH